MNRQTRTHRQTQRQTEYSLCCKWTMVKCWKSHVAGGKYYKAKAEKINSIRKDLQVIGLSWNEAQECRCVANFSLTRLKEDQVQARNVKISTALTTLRPQQYWMVLDPTAQAQCTSNNAQCHCPVPYEIYIL